jgi:Ca2+-binding RTX toxin-like protein
MLVGDTELVVHATLLYPTTPGNDFLAGGDGNDQLYGNAGSDVLLGGSGNDLLFGDDEGVELSQEGDDWLEGGDGIDQLMGRGGHDTLIGGADADILSGGAGNDTLVGGDGDDGGYGGAGDDEIVAGAGADQLDGEAGDDILFGDDGNDLLLGGEGLDEIDGGAGDDLLAGGDDDDVLFGDDGNDELQGGLGADLLAGDEGDDRLFGEDGADEIFGDRGADVLVGGADDDVLIGGEGNDQLVGDEGNDQLVGDAGNDVLVGGRGQDTFQFEPGGGFDVLVDSAGEGNRIVFGAGISASGVVAGVGPNDSLVVRTGNGTDAVQILGFGTANPESSHPIDQFEFFDGTVLTYAQLAARGLVSSGSQESDTLTGTVQHDDIYGGAGDDTIDGLDGGDAIRGEDGADRLQGGAGNDVLLGGSGNDVLLGGSEDDALFGGVGIDQFFGESGNDTIRGGAGSDYAEGGADDDSIYGETGDDWIFGDSNPNTVSSGGSVPIGGDDVIDGGDGNDDLRGGEGQDTLLGGSGIDLLDGGEGDDFLDGGAGDDARLDGGPGVDIVYGGAGKDRLYSGWRVTDSGGEVGGEGGGEPGALVATSQGVEQLFGEEGDDYLNSGSENFNTNDAVLNGGGGNDTFVVDSAGDAVIEAAAGGVDTIETFVSYTLPENVENLTFAGLAGLVGTGNALANVMRGMGQGTLDGRGGNDTLVDAQSYRFGRGDGQDAIVEYDTNGAPYFPGGPQDTIHLGAGIAPTDVVWQRMGNDLVLALNGTTDFVTIPSFYDVAFNQGDYRFSPSVYSPGAGIIHVSSLPYYVAPAQIERVQFADGAVWGPGMFNATQVGSFYADHYVFGRGDGQDAIIDFDFTSEQPADSLQMNVGISPGDVTVSRLGNDLVLGIEGTAEQFTVQSHFTSVFVLPPFAVTGRTVKAYQLEQVQFADGAVWDAAAILDRLVDVTGTEGDDEIQGGRNNSVIRGLGGTDILEGRSGDDRLDGGAGDDTLNGDEGDDQLTGDSGDDILRGGAGRDTYLFNLGDGIDTIEDVAAASEGNRIQFGTGISRADLAVTHDEVARTLTIQVGSSGTDRLVLTNFDPTGANGSLVVETLAFADGSTRSLAGYFAPAVTEGDDVLVTGSGDDVIDALGGNDRVEAGAGNDTITGGSGADLLIGGNGDDRLHLSLDGTWTSGFVAKNTGSPGTAGTGQTVSLKGKNRSFDVFQGDAGLDQILGTAGDDALGLDDLLSPFYDAAGPRLAGVEIIDVGDGRDVVDLTSQVHVYGDVTLAGGNGDDVLWTSAGNDVLEGGAGNDNLYGGVGIDELIGGDGNDTLDGASGADTLRGGPGNDVYLVDDGADVVIEQANEGTDTVKSAITYALGADLEHLTLTGTDPINGTGNDLNNTLTGNSAENVLAGGPGNDLYVVGEGDSVIESAGEGTDTIQSLTTRILPDHVERLTLTGTGAINGAGNALSNVLTGNSADNVLAGGAGNDTLRGGAGSDAYLFSRGDGQDVIAENDATAGNLDRLLFGESIDPLDLVLSRQVDDLRIAIHGTNERVTIQNWYGNPSSAQVEDLQAGNGQHLVNMQVDQLFQAMASFSQQTGLTWDQAIDQRPQEVQAVLAASWQS